MIDTIRTNKGRQITLLMLVDRGACSDYREAFHTLFGDSVLPTREVCVQHADDFDWDWAAEELLSDDACETWRDKPEYQQAQDALERAIQQAMDAFTTAVTPLREEHVARKKALHVDREANGTSWEEHHRLLDAEYERFGEERAPFSRKREEDLAPFLTAFHRVQATAWFDAWIADPYPVDDVPCED